MKALKTVGDMVSWLFELYAPVDGEKRVPFWDSEQPLIDGEPSLTANEIVAVRQLIEERFDVALEQTAEELAAVEPMPGWFRGGVGESSTSDTGAAPTPDVPAPLSPSAGGAGHPALLRAAAIQLDMWSSHVACAGAIFNQSLARQLRDAATIFENSSN